MAQRSHLEQYNVSDFLTWHREKSLTLNPHYQRRQVWTQDAKTYLIDTLLLGFPIPKVYLRTKIDIRSQKGVRDVVDGQQRLRAILEFAEDRLTLTKRSSQFRSMKYSDLDDELKQAFLSYLVGVEQLVNATDEDVLEVFSRLNAYTVPLNGAETRHAKFQSEFKWNVRELSDELRDFFLRYNILSSRNVFRMLDDALVAEMVGIICDGVSDGGEPALNTLYRRYDKYSPGSEPFEATRKVVSWLDHNLSDTLRVPEIARSPQFLILFAATAHQLLGIPPGKVGDMPERSGIANPQDVISRIGILAEAVAEEDFAGAYGDFVRASASTLQRMPSRNVRFRAFNAALTGD